MTSPATRAIARIRKLRQARGWSAQRLSDEMGSIGCPIGRPSLASMENGDRRLTVDELCAFALVFGLNPSQLLDESAVCEHCMDAPPPGYACLACGAKAEEAQ